MESRTHLIWRHAHQFINLTSVKWPTLAAEVRKHHEATVPEHQRTVEWSTHRDAHQRMTLDAQTLRRFENTATHRHGLPVELEDAMLDALHALHYARIDDLETDLAARRGMLPAPMLTVQANSVVTRASRLTKEFSDVLGKLAEAGEQITQEDAHLAKATLREINQLEGELHALKARYIEILPEQDRNVVKFHGAR